MSNSFFHANIPARRAALVGTIFPGITSFSHWLQALLSLSLSVVLRILTKYTQTKGELPIPSNFYVSYSVSVSCLHMNGSELGLKMQSKIY